MLLARLFVLSSMMLSAADWLHEGASQPLEREISAATAGRLKLIWKRKLGSAALSSPVILGRLITYRGTVELIYVSAADGSVYAVDGDFGKVFWTRRIEASGKALCAAPATPALTPNPPDVDPDADEDPPRRPLYVVAPDGMLHTLRPSDGAEDGPSRRLGCPAALLADARKAGALKVRRGGEVLANGVAFRLDAASGELQGLDAATREVLFRSGPTVPAAGGLAVANGHVCFTASDSTLSCYGFPME